MVDEPLDKCEAQPTVKDNTVTKRKRGRPPLTPEQRAKRPPPPGKWIPGGPGRPPLGEGQSKAVKLVRVQLLV